jgi:DNA-binding NarL/FixJ family response regulator
MMDGTESLGAVIVEDERMFSEMLARSLIDVSGLELMARAYTAEEGKAACARHRPALLILDLALPDGNGLDVLRALIADRPDATALILSAHAEDFVVPAELKDSIAAVVSKADAYGTVNDQVRRLVRAYVPNVEDEAALIDRLTPRELEVFNLLGEGLTNRGIAKRLSRSATTVATHRKMIAVKLRCSGAALMAMAARHRSHYAKIPS